jgi:dimethylaniline monooxygenase (N-oxide forming)
MFDAVIVGAGPGGIVCTKELLEHGVENIVCLEQSMALGGVFTTAYDNLLLTSSVPFSMFSDFWVGDGKGHHFWTKTEAVDYWGSYAEAYGVTSHIRFGSQVSSVSQSDAGHWDIRLSSGEIIQAKHLALATGNNSIPRFPNWRDLLTDVEVHHSKDYKNARQFEGKRVLVVGGGESASDIAFEISKVATKCWVSLRESSGWIVPRKRGEHAADISTHRGVWDLPREFGIPLSKLILKLERSRNDPVFDVLAEMNSRVRNPKGIWGTYGTKTLALPQAIVHHGCQVVDDVVDVRDSGRALVTAGGEILGDIDAVVFCTGYVNRVPFMQDKLQACDPRALYKHMFHPEFGGSLAFIGWARPGFGSQFPIMEMQSRLCASVFSGQRRLPASAEMEQVARADEAAFLEQFGNTARHLRSLVDYFHYMNDLAKIIGCYPPLWRYLFTHPILWLHIVYGPAQATQFRLRGPGKKVKLAQDILRKLPVSTFNHIVKAGLRARLYYALRWAVGAGRGRSQSTGVLAVEQRTV